MIEFILFLSVVLSGAFVGNMVGYWITTPIALMRIPPLPAKPTISEKIRRRELIYKTIGIYSKGFHRFMVLAAALPVAIPFYVFNKAIKCLTAMLQAGWKSIKYD